ncbi:MAG TPA: hypothetical protein DD401_07640 [Prevotella sp.]|nr:hypothetical protein [Prevotella sp.]
MGARIQGRATSLLSLEIKFSIKLLCGAMSEISWYKAVNFEMSFLFSVFKRAKFQAERRLSRKT